MVGSALSHACAHGRLEDARRCIAGGADVNEFVLGRTPLEACRQGHIDVATLLLDRGAEPDRTLMSGRTPLLFACKNNHVDAATLLLDRGAAVDKAMQGLTPLIIACQEDHVDMVRLCLARGADVNLARFDTATPLYISCEENRRRCAAAPRARRGRR